MKLSWSHKLFFQANRLAGKSKGFDALVRFFAEYAIFLLGLAILFGLWLNTESFTGFFWAALWTGLALALGIGVSFTFAWVWPHHRPKSEFPEITELITPLSHWKSLPSDHSLVSWVLAAAWLYYTDFGLAVNLIIALWAVFICLARVFAGVHYPRDIVAGTLLGWVVGLAFFR